VDEHGCRALQFAGGLFVQCHRAPEAGAEFCAHCAAAAAKAPAGLPPCGTVGERLEAGDDFRDAAGRRPLAFADFLAKKGLAVDRALREQYPEVAAREWEHRAPAGARGEPAPAGAGERPGDALDERAGAEAAIEAALKGLVRKERAGPERVWVEGRMCTVDAEKILWHEGEPVGEMGGDGQAEMYE
jgi:hypothetical protein